MPVNGKPDVCVVMPGELVLPRTSLTGSMYPLATPDAFAYIDRLLTWLEDLGLTFGDAEITMRHACALRPDGLRPEELVRYFCEAHDVDPDDAGHVADVAALMLYRRRLVRLRGGRYVTLEGQEEPRVMALVRVPASEWEAFGLGRYVHRGRAEWPADAEP